MFSKLKTMWESDPERQFFEKIRIFIYENPQKNLSKEQLYEILQYYENWNVCAKIRSERFEENVLHYIASRAFWSNMEDSGYATDIFLHSQRVFYHFMYFFYKDKEELTESELPDILDFFLRHANRCRLLIQDKRIVDHPSFYFHPCEMVVRRRSPELLLILLRHGALTITINDAWSLGQILRIIRFLIHKLLQGLSGSYNTNETEKTKFLFYIQCARIIIRVCPQLPNYKQISFLYSMPQESLKRVITTALPELEFRICKPITLKQICKLKIRQLLHERWLLPDGIEKLPLPQYLKNYLNLFCD